MRDLREFIEKSDKLGECKVIEGADWNLEIGAITEWQAKPNTPLLVFDKIKGYEPGYRVVTNLASTLKRLALLLGLSGVEEPLDLVKGLRTKTQGGFKPVYPVEVKTGPVTENVHRGKEINLLEFPAPKWHEMDGGRYLGTGHEILTKDPDEGWVNLGTYRVMVHDKNTMGSYIAYGQHGFTIRQKYWDKGQACPAVFVTGHDPLLWLISTTRIPWGVSEYEYTGWLRGRPIEVIKAPLTGLPVPAAAEIVIEGEIPPPEVETRMEGTFGEFTGYYAGGARPEPVFRIKSIMHRNDPIILGTPEFRIKPLYYWGRNIIRAAELWNQMEKIVPGIKGVWMMEEAAMHLPVISIKQQYAGHATDTAVAAKAITGMNNRYIIVVDDDIDPSNTSEVIWAVATRCEPAENIDVVRGSRVSRLDPRLTPEKRKSGDFTCSVALLNACKPYSWINDFPLATRASPELMTKTKKKWKGTLS